MKRERHKWLTSDGLDIFARAWSPASEPKALICLVHGFGEHSGRYPLFAEYVTGAGYALFTFDLRGHGKSGGKRGHAPGVEALMDDIGIFLERTEKFFPGLPRFLYGHSYGGNLVLNYCLRRRPKIKGIAVSGPLLRLALKLPPFTVTVARIMNLVWPSLVINTRKDGSGVSRDPGVNRGYEDDPLVHNSASGRTFACIRHAGEWAIEHASELKIPTLIMHGSEDKFTSVEASREFAGKCGKNCILKIWDGLYHELHSEPEKDEVFEYLIEWLDRHV